MNVDNQTSPEIIRPEISIFNPFVIEKESYVAGGCLRNCYRPEDLQKPLEYRDIDVFFYTETAYQSMYWKLSASADFQISYDNTNSVGFIHIPTQKTIDLITKQFGPPEKVVNSFDFTICQMAYFKHNDSYVFYRSDSCDRCHHNKVLELVPSQKYDPLSLDMVQYIIDPDVTFDRVIKYASYGYIPNLNLKKWIFRSIIKNNITDPISNPLKKASGSSIP